MASNILLLAIVYYLLPSSEPPVFKVNKKELFHKSGRDCMMI
jgi:hypothetical protein